MVHDLFSIKRRFAFGNGAMGMTCFMSMAAIIKVDFAGARLGLIGFGLLAYGVAFGLLEG